MQGEAYSRSLSTEAKAKLIEFIEACIESLRKQVVDETNDLAKAKGRAVLATDIDLVSFLTTIAAMYSDAGIRLVEQALTDGSTQRAIAELIVEVSELGRAQDKSRRVN
ncbi:hypothetical protein HYZ80_02280 [Candidatus Parcubacteria bacterium]|nr:hypothetical protein [Candidatus Parcubacteria bacterium]